jgi:adenosylcobyric acid synthase
MSAPAGLRGSLMVCGTTSDAGKSILVAGLCRTLARHGVTVAPFKGQNMSLNSMVTADGAEIGRAQAAQAFAAGVAPEAAMNPVLLKPTSDRRSQVVVLGRPWRTLDAVSYQDSKPQLQDLVFDSLEALRRRFDVVLLEGAGSPAEINLAEHDLVNLGLAARAKVPALLVVDIDRGGAFAHLYGTVALLPEERRRMLRGFLVNKFRGDPQLLTKGFVELEGLTGIATLGILPWIPGLEFDAEDSLALERIGRRGTSNTALDVAVMRLPRISNFTDLDPLLLEPEVNVRLVDRLEALGDPDLVIIPGTRSTTDDLAWLRTQGLADALSDLALAPGGPVVLGICGGYQMLGGAISDPTGVESSTVHVAGLRLLEVETTFYEEKRTRLRRGRQLAGNLAIEGYQIHHGMVTALDSAEPWFELDAVRTVGAPEFDGVIDARCRVLGSSLHGLFENDSFRASFLGVVAEKRDRPWQPSGRSFREARMAQVDRLADACEEHLDLDAVWDIVAHGAPA